ncbi:hypothetical protein KYE_19869 [Marinobacter manganoxydans MnI7-9]|uniref:Uncharacterized protein n=1 Tax=Marinobacter manganoxydans MnI7-9 TaxID=1094979 RepID=G6YZ60_9GAMM|nr:hypothetical protein KYE_19869 [Marinobacter manganoxydans MnI7-9]
MWSAMDGATKPPMDGFTGVFLKSLPACPERHPNQKPGKNPGLNDKEQGKKT